MTTETLFLFDATEYTVEMIAQVITEQLAQPYTTSDNLRTAVMYSPKTMTTAEWVAACALKGINAGTARNRLNEIRRWQRELGEID